MQGLSRDVAEGQVAPHLDLASLRQLRRVARWWRAVVETYGPRWMRWEGQRVRRVLRERFLVSDELFALVAELGGVFSGSALLQALLDEHWRPVGDYVSARTDVDIYIPASDAARCRVHAFAERLTHQPPLRAAQPGDVYPWDADPVKPRPYSRLVYWAQAPAASFSDESVAAPLPDWARALSADVRRRVTLDFVFVPLDRVGLRSVHDWIVYAFDLPFLRNSLDGAGRLRIHDLGSVVERRGAYRALPWATLHDGIWPQAGPSIARRLDKYRARGFAVVGPGWPAPAAASSGLSHPLLGLALLLLAVAWFVVRHL